MRRDQPQALFLDRVGALLADGSFAGEQTPHGHMRPDLYGSTLTRLKGLPRVLSTRGRRLDASGGEVDDGRDCSIASTFREECAIRRGNMSNVSRFAWFAQIDSTR